MICFNGNFLPENQPVLTASSPAVKWGQGIFETVRVVQGKIPLWPFHLQRIRQSLELLRWAPLPDLHQEALSLCQQNGLLQARLRIAIFPGSEGTDYLIEARELNASYLKYSEGNAGLCPDIRVSRGKFSGLKSASYQNYLLASDFATQNGWADAILLNDQGNICESSRANLFIIARGKVRTPALSQGGTDGVARRYLLHALAGDCEESEITVTDLRNAEEVFFTNALLDSDL